MNRAQKAEFVEQFNTRMAEAALVVLADYRGASSNEANDFRRNLEKHGLDLVVVKNTLARRAVDGTDKESLADHFAGMTGVIFSTEDPIAAAKAVDQCIDRKKGMIQVKGAFFEGEVLGENGIRAIAALPGREELLVMLLRTLQAGPRQVMGVIKGAPRDLLYLLKNYERKLAEGAEAE